MTKKKSLEQDLAELEALKAKEREVQERIKEHRARAAAEARKQHDRAVTAYGEMVVRSLAEGDWTRIRPEGLKVLLESLDPELVAAAECAGPSREPADAAKALREWEAAERAARKSAREAEAV